MPIFDQGYQHWSGQLGGRAVRWWAIMRYGVRAGMKSWVVRMMLLSAWSPAVLLSGMLCIWGLMERKTAMSTSLRPLLFFINSDLLYDPKAHRVAIWTLSYDRFLWIELRFSMILILLVGPSLISQDLRFNALPLYFSRPLRRIDYFIGKLGVILWFMGMVVIVPSIVAYILGMAFSLDLSIAQTFPILVSSVAYGCLIAVSAGLLVLAMSSLTRNSRYVALTWMGIWLVSSTVALVLMIVQDVQLHYDYNVQQQQGEFISRPDFMAAAVKHDWRPIVAYVTDLQRVGEKLLGSQKAWEELSKQVPVEYRTEYLLNYAGYQYPWQWSAGVLAGLFGLSVLILNFRVKSLDRLR